MTYIKSFRDGFEPLQSICYGVDRVLAVSNLTIEYLMYAYHISKCSERTHLKPVDWKLKKRCQFGTVYHVKTCDQFILYDSRI